MGATAALLLRQRAGRPGADGRAPEIAELGPAHGNAAELSGNQAAAVLTGRRISAPAIRRVFEAHEAISSKFTRI